MYLRVEGRASQYEFRCHIREQEPCVVVKTQRTVKFKSLLIYAVQSIEDENNIPQNLSYGVQERLGCEQQGSEAGPSTYSTCQKMSYKTKHTRGNV